jgi:ATP-dependent protease ClpP protease subunit
VAGTATVLIEGPIYPDEWFWWDEPSGVSLKRVRDAITAAGEFDNIKLLINSEGGICEEGWAIYDYLDTLGKEIETVVIGQCDSMATVIKLLGKNRFITKHSGELIHNPWGGVVGDSKQVIAYGEELATEEQRIIAFYAEKTGTADTLLAELMDAETKMTAEQSIQYGFSTGYYQPAAAMAGVLERKRNQRPAMIGLKKYGRPDGRALPTAPQVTQPSNNTMSTKTKNSLIAGLKSLLGIAEGTAIMALDVTVTSGPGETSGKTLKIETVGENDIAVGDAVTIDGSAAPDGEYTLSDGRKIVVADGSISEIPAADSTDDTSDDDTQASTEGETVTIPKSEYDSLKAAQTQAAALATAQTQLTSLQSRIKAVFGGKDLSEIESADVITKAGGKVSESPQARGGTKDPVLSAGEAAVARKKEREAAQAAKK